MNHSRNSLLNLQLHVWQRQHYKVDIPHLNCITICWMHLQILIFACFCFSLLLFQKPMNKKSSKAVIETLLLDQAFTKHLTCLSLLAYSAFDVESDVDAHFLSSDKITCYFLAVVTGRRPLDKFTC